MPSSSRCNRCNRTLTDPVSVRQGYGPVCWRKRREERGPRGKSLRRWNDPFWISEEMKHRHLLAEALEKEFFKRGLEYLAFSGHGVDLLETREGTYPEDLIAQLVDAGIPVEYAA